MANYGHIQKNTDPEAHAGGYKNVFYFCPVADFLALQTPTNTPTDLGDVLTISTAHTFTAPKGFFEYAAKKNSVTLKGATVGEPGAKEMEWTGEFIILGDSASTQEQIQRLLNDEVICLVKDADCAAGTFVQLGNECVYPEFTAEFTGNTTAEGKKEYKLTVVCRKKYFYTGAVTKAA